jgi:ADP-ribose pyrophosphatase YjhB (NUDIX family)
VKSGAEENEKYEDTALRSIKEKLGLDGTIVEDIGKIEYVASHPEKKKILKVVAYFLMEAPYKELELKSNGGLDKAEWMAPETLVDLTIYDDILPAIAKAIEIINK